MTLRIGQYMGIVRFGPGDNKEDTSHAILIRTGPEAKEEGIRP